MQIDKDPYKKVGRYSIDTGMSENPILDQYFNINSGFYSGNYEEMRIGRRLEGTGATTLILKPTERRNVEVLNDEL